MLDPALGNESQCGFEDGQRLQAEKVELQQTGALDPFHVELRHRHRRARIAIERHQRVEPAIADHDAGGMGRGMAVEPSSFQRHVEQLLDRRILVAGGA